MEIKWNEVTWYSRALAVLVLIAVAILAFYIGTRVQDKADQKSTAIGTVGEQENGSSMSSSNSNRLPFNYTINLSSNLEMDHSITEPPQLDERKSDPVIQIKSKESGDIVGLIEPTAYAINTRYILEPVRLGYVDSDGWLSYEITTSHKPDLFNMRTVYSNQEEMVEEIQPEIRNDSPNKLYRYNIPGVCDAGPCGGQGYFVITPTNQVVFAWLPGDIVEDQDFIESLFSINT